MSASGLASQNARVIQAPERIAALEATGLLDSAPEVEFDRITQLACQVLGVPVSLVALLDADRSYFKSAVGLPELPPDRSVPFSHSLCQYAVAEDAPFCVADTRADAVARENGAVKDMGAGAYLGVPLHASDGQVLGTLCAADFESRDWTESDQSTLQTLAAALESEISLRSELAERHRAEADARAEAAVLATVIEVNASVAAELDLDRLVQAVVDAGRCLTGAAFAAFFYSTDPSERPAYLFTVSGAARELFEGLGRVRMTPLFEPSFSGREVVRIADVRQDERFGKMGGVPEGHLPVTSYLSVPVRDRDGAPLGALLFGHPEADVFDEKTERAALAISDQAAIALQNGRLYRRLEENDRQHRSVLASLDDIVFQIDAHGHFTYLNGSWEAKTGYAVSDTLGRPLLDFDERSQSGSAAQMIDSESALGAFLEEHGHMEVKTKTGALLHMEVRWQSAFDDEGQVSGAAGTMVDVTDTMLYQAERKARVEAERMTRLRDSFLRNISHEVRTPLTVMMGSADVLVEELRDVEEGEFLSAFANDIRDGGQRLMTTLDNVLELAQIQAGQLRPLWAPAFVPSVVESAVEPLLPLAEAKGLSFVLDLDESRRAVNVDSRFIHRLVVNLVGNAIKFTEHGFVRVSTRFIEAQPDGDAQAPGELEVVVEDSGIGIPEEALPYLFEEFQQASESDARSHEGCGIGLALVRHAVRLLGGTVEADSTLGKGSRFRVAIPLPARVGAAVPKRP